MKVSDIIVTHSEFQTDKVIHLDTLSVEILDSLVCDEFDWQPIRVVISLEGEPKILNVKLIWSITSTMKNNILRNIIRILYQEYESEDWVVRFLTEVLKIPRMTALHFVESAKHKIAAERSHRRQKYGIRLFPKDQVSGLIFS